MSSELVANKATILTGLSLASTIPERIGALRDAGLSYKALAYAVGATTNALSSWHNHRAEPRVKYVRRLDSVRRVTRTLIEDVGLEPGVAADFLARKKERAGVTEYPILEQIRENPQHVFTVVDAFARRHAGPAEATIEPVDDIL